MVQVEKLNNVLRVVRSMIQIIIVCYLLFFFDPPFESAKIWGIFGLPIRQGLPDWLGQVAANNEPCHKIRYPRYLMCMFGLYPYWGSYPHYEPYQHNMVISFLFRSLMEEPFPKGHGVFFSFSLVNWAWQIPLHRKDILFKVYWFHRRKLQGYLAPGNLPNLRRKRETTWGGPLGACRWVSVW